MASAHTPDHVIGIDFGTSFTRAAVFRNGNVEIIPIDEGKLSLPSYVAFTEEGRVVGEAAKGFLLTTNVSNVVFGMKHMLGKTYDDPFIQESKAHWPFQVVAYEGKPRIKVVESSERKSFSVEEITAIIFRHIKKQAEVFLGQQVKRVVISIPVCFNDTKQKALKEAADIAGLNVIRLLSDTAMTAIEFDYTSPLPPMTREMTKESTRFLEKGVLVVSIGGGTTSVSVVDIKKDTGSSSPLKRVIKIISDAGDCNLGGEVFDKNLMDFCIKNLDSGEDLIASDNKLAIQKLRSVCEDARLAVSSNMETDALVKSLNVDDFCKTIIRNCFDHLYKHLIESIKSLIEKAFRDSKTSKDDLVKAIFVGGLSRFPRIRSQLIDFVGGDISICREDCETAVVRGLAIYGNILGPYHSVNSFVLT